MCKSLIRATKMMVAFGLLASTALEIGRVVSCGLAGRDGGV